MAVHKLTPEQMNESFAQFGAGNTPNSPNPPATSAEDVFNRVGRAQERRGTAGHQADFYVPSDSTARGAFAAVNQEIRTNPAPPSEEHEKPVDLNAVTGDQPVVSHREAQTGNEQQPLARTAVYAGHTALEKTAEPQQPFTPLPLEAIGDVLNGEPQLPEQPFAATWAPPQGSPAQQSEHVDIQGRLAGF